MAVQKQDDQHEHTFSSYVRIRDVVLKTYLGRWTIGRSGERGSGISVLPARDDDDDDDVPLTERKDHSLSVTQTGVKILARVLAARKGETPIDDRRKNG